MTRFVSFHHSQQAKYGLARPDGIVDLSQIFGATYPSLRHVLADNALAQLADAAGKREVDLAYSDVIYDIPIPNAEKIICVGVNYPDRNEEYKDGQSAPQKPSLFVRFARSFVGHESPIVCPNVSEQFDYEGEIVLIIGKGGRHIAEKDALSHIAGMSLCNEGSVRDWIRHGKFNVTQGKNFDASGSIGPWMTLFTYPSQLENIQLSTRVNGELRQDDRTSRMIFGFSYLVAYISTFTTLVPGDMIVTGTPTGAGARLDPPVWLKPDDIVEIEAAGLGLLRNKVMAEKPKPQTAER